MPVIYHPKTKKPCNCDPDQLAIMLNAGYLKTLEAPTAQIVELPKRSTPKKGGAKKGSVSPSKTPASDDDLV